MFVQDEAQVAECVYEISEEILLFSDKCYHLFLQPQLTAVYRSLVLVGVLLTAAALLMQLLGILCVSIPVILFGVLIQTKPVRRFLLCRDMSKYQQFGAQCWTFYQTKFHGRDLSGMQEKPYAALHAVYETSDFFYICMTAQSGCALPKAAFLPGTAALLSAQLQSTMGNKFIQRLEV